MKYTILTLFPDLVRPWTEESIVQKAIQKGLIEVDIRDIRAHTEDKHKTVDDTPYGGGAGMVMRVDVVVRAIEAAGPADEVILLTPAAGRLPSLWWKSWPASRTWCWFVVATRALTRAWSTL